MLLIKSFYNRGNYISPEDELTIYKEVTSLFLFWREIVVKYSNKRRFELENKEKEQLHGLVKQLQNFEFKKDESIGFQLDKLIVEILVYGSVIANRKNILNEIYSKTKSSMFNYFHHELLVEGYLKINDENAAISIIEYLFNKNHIAYLFALQKYREEKYIKYAKFHDRLVGLKHSINAKALAQGEKIDLKNVSYADLVQLVQQAEKYLKRV